MHAATPSSSTSLLRHTLATLAYRAGKTLRGAPAEFASYKAGTAIRTPAEVLAHMGDLLDWALSLANGKQAWHDSTPLAWDDEVKRFFGACEALDARLGSADPPACSQEALFRGPIADALWHAGQIAMLRRLGGAPIKGENYLRAEITTGRVGCDQPAPVQEFE